ncbi:MAG: STAS domain-containing protein [Calditrichaeota bacterium]|nr:STAS domain-containing protein [Calditrichota bacterium]
MEQNQFEVIRQDQDDISILTIKGYLDAHTAPDFEKAIQELLESNRYKIVIDFSDLNYISSAGLGVFMGFIEDVRKNGGDIKLAQLNDRVFKIFDLLGFPNLYEIYENLGQAIEKFKSA